MDRRAYLGVCATVAGLAGCGGATDAPPQEPATFDLVTVRVPEAVPVGDDFRVGAVVQNTGDEAGTVTSLLSVRREGDWEQTGTLEVEVEPGVARAWRSGPIAAGADSDVKVRLDRFDVTATVAVGPGEYRFGRYYRGPDGLLLTAYDASLTQAYQYETDSGTATHEAPTGSRWAFVRLNAENRGDSPVTVPETSAFTLLVEGEPHSPVDVRRQRGRWTGGTLAPGETRDGRVAYEVPASTAVGDLVLRWHPEGAVAPVRFRPEG